MTLEVLQPTQMAFLEVGISLYLKDHTKLHLFLSLYYTLTREHNEHQFSSGLSLLQEIKEKKTKKKQHLTLKHLQPQIASLHHFLPITSSAPSSPCSPTCLQSQALLLGLGALSSTPPEPCAAAATAAELLCCDFLRNQARSCFWLCSERAAITSNAFLHSG